MNSCIILRAGIYAAFVILSSTIAQARVMTGYVNSDQHVVVSSDFAVFGLDLISEGGYLVPIPPGDVTAPADPFQFLLTNSPNHIAYSSFGRSVLLDNEVLSAKYAPPEGVLATDDLTGTCAAGFQPCTITISDVPEPPTSLLFLFSALAFLGFRVPRNFG